MKKKVLTEKKSDYVCKKQGCNTNTKRKAKKKRKEKQIKVDEACPQTFCYA